MYVVLFLIVFWCFRMRIMRLVINIFFMGKWFSGWLSGKMLLKCNGLKICFYSYCNSYWKVLSGFIKIFFRSGLFFFDLKSGDRMMYFVICRVLSLIRKIVVFFCWNWVGCVIGIVVRLWVLWKMLLLVSFVVSGILVFR